MTPISFEADDIRDWRGHDVVDVDRNKIGTLEAIYFDTATQEPSFASVTVGIIGRRRITFVPLDGARVSPSHVRVMTNRKLVKGAPTIDADGELTADAEPQLFDHYGIPYQPGATGERRLGRR